MISPFEKNLGALSRVDRATLSKVLIGGRTGIEKECLRVDRNGQLSGLGHPEELGSALTNPFITTDYSEALLEFVTPAYKHTWEALRTLCDIHQFTYQHLGDELLWPASMPCKIPADDDIPLACYGTSNVGQMKTVYRRGLGYRYGRHMQTIAGVHFNYSMPVEFWRFYRDLLGDPRDEESFRSDQYMGLVRNFRRYGWVLLYLFGASPALCKTFMGDQQLDMPTLNKTSWYEPFGTSLRMSDLGYSSRSQSKINIRFDNLSSYIRDLSAAISTPEPAYEKIGVKVDGLYRQLNAHQLQIENEYYSSIRPKRVARSGERPTTALRRGGVEYVEVRSLDINIFDPCGINQNAMRFIEVFLIYCVLEDGRLLDQGALDESQHNHALTAKRGREPGLQLSYQGKPVALDDWMREILDKVARVAELLDFADGADTFMASITDMQAMLEEPEATPSARILAEMRTAGCSFFEFAMSVAEGHRNYFESIAPLPNDRLQHLEDEARLSLQKQAEIEASDSISFDEYLEQYFSSA